MKNGIFLEISQESSEIRGTKCGQNAFHRCASVFIFGKINLDASFGSAVFLESKCSEK
jgi:hypothetical protein